MKPNQNNLLNNKERNQFKALKVKKMYFSNLKVNGCIIVDKYEYIEKASNY